MVPLLTDEEIAAAERDLSVFPERAQAIGRQILGSDQIKAPDWDMFDVGYRAQIRCFWARASFSKGRWRMGCSCANQPRCEHSYALLVRVLQMHAPGANITESKAGEQGGENLNEFSRGAIEGAIGRTLHANERSYLNRVHALWRKLQANGQISFWDLDQLGYNTWKPGRIWGETPSSPYSFWLHIAHAINGQGGPIPDFLQPVLDFSLIRGSLAKLQREEEISRWQLSLDQFSSIATDVEPEPIDLRLKLLEGEVRVEYQRSRASAFEPLKKTLLKALLNNYTVGSLAVVPECSAIWEALSRGLGYPSIDFDLQGESMREALNVLLRLPGLEERIVNAQGMPLFRLSRRVSWKLEELKDSGGDCRLSLRIPEEGAPGKFLIALDGSPPLYVFENAICSGPPVYEFLPPNVTHVIPAPVLESPQGIALLDRLSVELPLPLEALIERVRLRPRIHCKLIPSYPGSPSELLTITVTAHDEMESHAETLTESGWSTLEAKPRRRKGASAKIPLFDRSALKSIPSLLHTLASKWDYYAKSWQCRVTRNFPETFSNWLASIPESVELLLDPALESFRGAPLTGTIQLDCTETEIDWFDLKVTLNVSDTELTPEEIQLLLNGRGQFVRLRSKGWRKLDLNVTDEDDQALARLGLSMSEFSSEPQRLHALQLADEAARKFLPEERVENIRRRAAEIKTRVTPDVPAAVRAQLRPYQLEGFHFLAYLAANRFGGILADDMGLGKTVQTLTWLEWIRVTGKPAPSIVVCPKSVMETWRNEAGRFLPGLRVKLWKGTDAEGLQQELRDTDLLVLNYAQIRSLGEALAKVHWQAAILDEGQYIKNPDSQTAQVARALRADYRLALSGTPIENRLLDLWSLMAFAMPGVLGNRAQFGRQFNVNADPLARRRLAARVRPFLLRRTKSQVAKDLPERVEEDLLCELEGQQKTLYRAELKHAQQMLLKVKTSKELNEFRFHFLTSLLRLRQICCHPALVNPDLSQAESAKLDACLELLEPLMEEGHKVLVFSQFVSMLEILRGAMKERDWQHFYLAGDTENRGELVDTFQKADGAATFLISLKAGGFGLNLTAASYVVLFDPWWNPAVENQAIDRTHRIGQTRKVIAYRLLMKDSIEEKIRALQRSKSAIAEDILGEENFAKSLTLTDLQFLFGDADA